MAATLAAAIFGSGRDLVCSTVSSPREGRFAYRTHVLGGMALDRPPRPPRRTCGDIELGTTPAWVDHVVRGRGVGLSRLRKRRQR